MPSDIVIFRIMHVYIYIYEIRGRNDNIIYYVRMDIKNPVPQSFLYIIFGGHNIII